MKHQFNQERRVFSDEQHTLPVAALMLSQEPRSRGLGGAGRGWWSGKAAVSMCVLASFLPGVTSRGFPLLGTLEHTALRALMKDQGYMSAAPT